MQTSLSPSSHQCLWRPKPCWLCSRVRKPRHTDPSTWPCGMRCEHDFMCLLCKAGSHRLLQYGSFQLYPSFCRECSFFLLSGLKKNPLHMCFDFLIIPLLPSLVNKHTERHILHILTHKLMLAKADLKGSNRKRIKRDGQRML